MVQQKIDKPCKFAFFATDVSTVFHLNKKAGAGTLGVKSEKVKHIDYRGDPQLSPHAKIWKICSANSLQNAENLILALVIYI